jgi:hypothetical protein
MVHGPGARTRQKSATGAVKMRAPVADDFILLNSRRRIRGPATRYALSRAPWNLPAQTLFASSFALSVRSHVNVGSLRPKWP